MNYEKLKGVSQSDDAIQSLPLVYNAEKIILTNIPLYYYRTNPKSQTYNIDLKSIEDVLKTFEITNDYIDQKGYTHYDLSKRYNRYVRSLATLYASYTKNRDTNKLDKLKLIKLYKRQKSFKDAKDKYEKYIKDGNSFTYKGYVIIISSYGWKVKIGNKIIEFATDKEAKEYIDLHKDSFNDDSTVTISVKPKGYLTSKNTQNTAEEIYNVTIEELENY